MEEEKAPAKWYDAIYELFRKSPLIFAFSFLVYRDIQREKVLLINDTFIKEQLLFFRDIKLKELSLKEKELTAKYAKDTLN